MSFFQKFFQKKITIQDVLLSLENFSNDVKSLNNVSQISSEFFGVNWKFNLEMYINTMPKDDKEKYLSLFYNVLTFDKALGLWTSAQQVLKGAKTLSADMIKDIGEYEEYLPKFGVEGVRLLEKFKEKFNFPNVITPKDENVVEDTKKVEDVVDVNENESEPETEKVEVQEDVKIAPVSSKILHKVSVKDLKEGVFCKFPHEEKTFEEEKVEPIANNSIDDDWELKNFKMVHNFVSQVREVMSAISLFKNAQSLEEYPYYGFVIDTIDYLIAQGNKILSIKSNEEIEKYFPAGAKEVEDIISFYTKQKQDEVVMPVEMKSDEKDKKEYEIIED